MIDLLLIAPTCDGEDVGEAWVGYQWVRRLAKRHNVTLLTYNKRGKRPASDQFPTDQFPRLRVVEWLEPPLAWRAERFNSMLKPGYFLFYLKSRRWIMQALASGERFDLAHQLVPVAMRYPSPVAGLGIPFIIGPVGGSLDTPPGFHTDADSAPWYVGLRALDRLRMRVDPTLRRTYDSASCVIGIGPYVSDFLQGRSIRQFEIMSETGIEKVPDPVDRSHRSGPVRLLYVGRVVRTKGVRDAIRALKQLGDLPVTLDIIGDGFDMQTCKMLALDAGISDRVAFHGRKARSELDEFYRAADIFVFPSYREPGGNAVFEAMSHGLPLIVSDRGGPERATDENCAIRIDPKNPEQFAQAIADAIRRLVVNPDFRLSLGQHARRRVADIALWDRKVELLDTIYERIMETESGRQGRCSTLAEDSGSFF